MFCVLSAVILTIGLGLGGGLLYASHRMRGRLQCIENARPCKAGNPGEGLVKLHGTVKAVNPGELLISPMEQKPCVYFKLLIEQFQQSMVSSGRPASVGRTTNSGSWVPVIEDVQAIPMVIADETGAIAIDPSQATLDFQQNRTHANFLSSLPAELEESLKARYKIVTKTWFLAKQMRYSELVIAHEQEVFVVGDCEMKDGKPTLTKKSSELMMTFRKEAQVLRNGKISVTIFKIAAIVVPVLALVLAICAYVTQPEQPGAARANAAKDSGKESTAIQSIAKLKNKSAGLSDRAWAARKLGETPVLKKNVAEVAPLLNPLLESTDSFHRESAVLAIKQGWGSAVNESALKRVQQNTTDARLKREVAAALHRIGR